jgi:hypothetical protein
VFLVDCAQAQAWIPLLAYAQVASLSPSQLNAAVREHVSNPALRSHLHVAVGRIVAAQSYKKVISFIGQQFSADF